MKFILLFLILFFAPFIGAKPLEFGALNRAVIDQTGLLTPEDQNLLESKIRTFYQEGGAQIAIFISKDLEGYAIEEYSIKLAEAWKLGGQKDDDGLLIVVAPNEKKIRLEVGQGLEGILTDFQSKSIISKIIAPEFKQGQYGVGLNLALDHITGLLKGDESKVFKPRGRQGAKVPWWVNILFLIIMIFILPIILKAQGHGSYSGYGRSSGSGYSPWGGGGSSSGGGSSWGGGGGGFSGGGASGDW